MERDRPLSEIAILPRLRGMTMQITKESHLDHGLSEAVVNYLLSYFADRREFFIATVELPADLGTVPCGIVGPAVGGSSPRTSREDRRRAHPRASRT